MSNLAIPREPAFSGLIPNAIQYLRLGGEVLDLLQEAIGSGEYFYKAENKPSIVNLTGYYRYKNLNKEQFFLKIVPASYRESLENANSISLWVRNLGIKTPLPCIELTRHISGHIIYFYEFVGVARFFNEDAEDIRSLGQGLAQLHDALSGYPEREVVKLNSKHRSLELSLFRQLILNNQNCVDIEQAALKSLLESEECILNIDSYEISGQVLHGDLVRGNVLFQPGEVDPIFIDFEDSYFSYGGVEFDIALVIERFILCGNEKSIDTFAYIFSESYLKNRKSKTKLFNCQLDQILKYLSLKALIVLSQKKQRGYKINASEWKKFINLYHNVDRNITLIHRIENYFKIR